MSEEKVIISVDQEITLSGGYTPAGQTPPGGAMVLHPHPLYGGSMHNNVVETCVRAAHEAGWAALRFNFRGVGGSTGQHDQGKGEVEDVLASARWLTGRAPGRVIIIGYSFGSLVGSQAAPRVPNLAGGVWVAPPLILGPLSPWPQDAGPLLLIAGESDQYTNMGDLRAYAKGIGARGSLHALDGVDHFFWSAESVLFEKVHGFFAHLE